MSTRRHALKTLLAGAAAFSASPNLSIAGMTEKTEPVVRKGNIRHAVCRWCFNDVSLDDLCLFGKQIGIEAIDLVGPKDWDTLKKHGISSSMCNGAEIGLVDGWNEPKFHAQLIQNYTDMIPLVAKAGYTNLICFSGNRRGMPDDVGLKNCADGLKKIMSLAEKNGVIIHMELLNSRVDHKDYMCDKTPWGVELCKSIDSPNFKLLYDIYHMQIDEGDVIRRIREHHAYIGHYHTAGVPGRHEIDESQELYYPAIMRAIVETGHKGYVAQEFIPVSSNKLASLAKAVDICDV
ncbi:MAG: TIM barrel protein [Saprospiraceae bacterium]|nr:TIM barrel protein [Saprospiraceae bacterium]